jgi:hypothetical protein
MATQLTTRIALADIRVIVPVWVRPSKVTSPVQPVPPFVARAANDVAVDEGAAIHC